LDGRLALPPPPPPELLVELPELEDPPAAAVEVEVEELVSVEDAPDDDAPPAAAAVDVVEVVPVEEPPAGGTPAAAAPAPLEDLLDGPAPGPGGPEPLLAGALPITVTTNREIKIEVFIGLCVKV
jgi:hypothetical protein